MASMNHVINCDFCGENFLSNLIDIKQSKISLNNQVIPVEYFECPKCKYIYIVTIWDRETEEIKKKIAEQKNKLRKYAAKVNSISLLEDMQYKLMCEKLEVLKNKFMRKQAVLKRKYRTKIEVHLHPLK